MPSTPLLNFSKVFAASTLYYTCEAVFHVRWDSNYVFYVRLKPHFWPSSGMNRNFFVGVGLDRPTWRLVKSLINRSALARLQICLVLKWLDYSWASCETQECFFTLFLFFFGGSSSVAKAKSFSTPVQPIIFLVTGSALRLFLWLNVFHPVPSS